MEFKSWGEYIDYLKKNGYIADDLKPMKCFHCESKKLESRNEYYDDVYLMEYDVYCVDCGKYVAKWSYGYWDF